MEAAGLIEKVEQPRPLRFHFEDIRKLPPPIIAFNEVAFSYSGKSEDYLYKKLSFGIELRPGFCFPVLFTPRLTSFLAWTRVWPSWARTERASRRCFISSRGLSNRPKAPYPNMPHSSLRNIRNTLPISFRTTSRRSSISKACLHKSTQRRTSW
jgi:hypothetical protein